MPPLLLTDLPTTRQLVKATILAVGLAAAAPGCGDDGGTPDTGGPAPTCGPCCHGGTDCDSSLPPPIDSSVEAGPADASPDAADASGDAAADAPPGDAAADGATDAG
jgi:hypothetical protein